ncbi:hypothetical protein Vretimale_11634 [Volvox reticuliferus]|uniref:Phosphoglycerate kinase n=1 Tax=Volvox reticuliferus TaxID=1737510 RepID=A0A8J4CTJ8_9CHLO|nr:hypothetical protein Vretifemale_14775 [Volvox reticuliferus]GIM07529.1 hypothetical protein Vretimale_11634 [Volvox reticuliferus]
MVPGFNLASCEISPGNIFSTGHVFSDPGKQNSTRPKIPGDPRSRASTFFQVPSGMKSAGKFEVPEFAVGTVAVARALDEASKRGAVTIIGGSDSVAAVTAAGLAEHITHISTGGGATLELIEGKGMPGLRALLRHGSGGAGVCGGGGGGSRSSTSDSVAAGGIPFDDKR